MSMFVILRALSWIVFPTYRIIYIECCAETWWILVGELIFLQTVVPLPSNFSLSLSLRSWTKTTHPCTINTFQDESTRQGTISAKIFDYICGATLCNFNYFLLLLNNIIYNDMEHMGELNCREHHQNIYSFSSICLHECFTMF